MRRILFICWGNCVRSQMAEALLRYRCAGRMESASGGIEPAGFVHPLAVESLRELNVPTRNLESKPWDVWRGRRVDAIISLDEEASRELREMWPDDMQDPLPARVHVHLTDPSAIETPGRVMSNEERMIDFRTTRNELRNIVERLAITPADILDDDEAFAQYLQGMQTAKPEWEG